MSRLRWKNALGLARIVLATLSTVALAQEEVSLKGWSGTIVRRDTEFSDYSTQIPSEQNVTFGDEQHRGRYVTIWTIRDGEAHVTYDERTWTQEHSGHTTWPLACTPAEWTSGTGHLWEENSGSRTETQAHFEGEGECSMLPEGNHVTVTCIGPSFSIPQTHFEWGSCTGCCDAEPHDTQTWQDPESSSELEGDTYGGFGDEWGTDRTVLSGSEVVVEDGYRSETSWSLKRDNAYVLEVSPKNYETWLPRGSRSEDVAGNGLVLRATLKRLDGAPLDVGAKEVIFKLVSVSSEPGVSMNFPPAPEQNGSESPKAANPDLRFEAAFNKDLSVSDDGMTATREGKSLSGAYAVLSSFDFGAYGAITVEAVLTTGEVVHGHLEGDDSVLQILVPQRNDALDPIASSWREVHDVRAWDADGDDDTEPLGDLHMGDGLTLYEEYRGFHIGGRHLRLDPTRKDLFVVNNVGTLVAEGSRVFERASHMIVHDQLRRDEITKDRVVNFNTSGAYNVVAQHAVIANRAPPSQTSMTAVGGPGTPGRIREVLIASGWSLQNARSGVAHELAHSSSVPHHGEGDLDEQWELRNDEIYASRADGDGGTVIRVFEEDGTTEVAGIDALLRFSGKSAVPQGQHSGDRRCLMAYRAATALTRGATDRRYLPSAPWEPRVPFLCADSAGTLSNAPDHPPAPRCGPAQEGHGKCQDFLCINDLRIH